MILVEILKEQDDVKECKGMTGGLDGKGGRASQLESLFQMQAPTAADPRLCLLCIPVHLGQAGSGLLTRLIWPTDQTHPWYDTCTTTTTLRHLHHHYHHYLPGHYYYLLLQHLPPPQSLPRRQPPSSPSLIAWEGGTMKVEHFFILPQIFVFSSVDSVCINLKDYITPK